MVTNAETLANTTDAVVKATGDDMPAGLRAVTVNFKTDKGACSVAFDRYSTDHQTFSNLNQMISNALGSVIESGRKVDSYTVWLVR